MARTNVPRASIGVSLLAEEDFALLMQLGAKGQAAFGAFVALIVAAKDRDNGGVFVGPLGIAAGMCRIKEVELRRHIATIELICKSIEKLPWIYLEGQKLIIRSYSKWNKRNENWGGKRGQDDPQDATQDGGQDESNLGASQFVTTSSNSNSQSDVALVGGAGGRADIGKCTRSQVEAIYALYPRKTAKARAIAAIGKSVRKLADASNENPLRFLQDAVLAFAASPAGQTPPPNCEDFRPYPATFFNDERYFDDRNEWQRHNSHASSGANRGKASASATTEQRRADEAERLYAPTDSSLPILDAAAIAARKAKRELERPVTLRDAG